MNTVNFFDLFKRGANPCEQSLALKQAAPDRRAAPHANPDVVRPVPPGAAPALRAAHARRARPTISFMISFGPA
jgi:hypothetical protein